MSKFVRVLQIAICTVVSSFAIACGGSSGGTTTPPPPPPPPPIERALYVADQITDTVNELFLVDLTTPGTSVRLNAPVTAANITPQATYFDDNELLYRSDHTTLGVQDLYTVSLSNPGVATRVNATLVAGANGVLTGRPVSGTRYAYVGDQDTVGTNELYLSDLAVPGVSTKLSPPLVVGGNVQSANSLGGVFVVNGGNTVIMLADVAIDNVDELFRIDLATPGVAVRLHPVLPAGRSVAQASLSPDGTKIAYIADQDTAGVDELYLVTVATPGVSTKLNGALTAGGNVQRVQFTEDSSAVIYTADQVVDNQTDLFSVSLATPGVSIKLNPAFADANRDVDNFVQSANSDTMYYNADQDTLSVNEWYRVSRAAPGATTKVSGLLGVGGTIPQTGAYLNVPETHFLYVADIGSGVRHAYVVDLSAPGTAVQASDNLIAGSGGVGQAFWNAQGDKIQYDADQVVVGQDELWLVTLSSMGPGNSVRLNAPFAATAEIAGGHAPFPLGNLLRQSGL